MTTPQTINAVVFWTCAGLVFCAYAGYPLLIWVLSRVPGRGGDPPAVADADLPGVSCLTLRNITERPVTVEQGLNILVGLDPDRIIAATRDVLATIPARFPPITWDESARQLTDRLREVVAETSRSAQCPIPSIAP